MKKLKIISTIGALVLMTSILVFGVYAATTVSFKISTSVTYVVSDVKINIRYGQNGQTAKTLSTSGPNGEFQDLSTTPYPLTDGTLALDQDNPTVLYVTIENLHGRAIYVNFNHTFTVPSGQENIVTATGGLYSGEVASTTAVSFTKGTPKSIDANSVVTYKVTLSVTNPDKKLTSATVKISMAAALNAEGAALPA